MTDARKVTTEDLARVKGLGEAKAVKVLEALDTGTPEDLTEITGVSERLAKEVHKLVKNPDKYKPEPPTPRKARERAEFDVDPKTKRISKKATKKATTNGSNGHKLSSGKAQVSAGDVRRFAKDAERIGFETLASSLRLMVSALTDDEKIPAEKLGV